NDSRFGVRNRFSYSLPALAVWNTVRKPVNGWRTERGLPRFPANGASRSPLSNPTQHHHYDNRFPVVNGYSDLVAPRQVDYPDWHHNCGFWSLDGVTGYEPPPELVDFLAAGPPPVCIGFGSIPVLDPNEMWPTIAQAVKLARQRAVVLTGWGGLE